MYIFVSIAVIFIDINFVGINIIHTFADETSRAVLVCTNRA